MPHQGEIGQDTILIQRGGRTRYGVIYVPPCQDPEDGQLVTLTGLGECLSEALESLAESVSDWEEEIDLD